MPTAQNDNAQDTRIPVPMWRDAGAWFGFAMVILLGALGLWRASAFG